MIYEATGADAPLQQGDILHPVPIAEFDPLQSFILDEDGNPTAQLWQDARPETAVVNARLRSTWAIVSSQDCETARADQISLFEVGMLANVSGESLPREENHKNWVDFITKHPKINPGWFYLPQDTGTIGFPGRMAVDFGTLFQLPRDSLVLNLSSLRKGRLNNVSLVHFRHAMAFFFTRFAFDDWYTLTKDEFAAYAGSTRESVPPFPWQL